MTQREKLKALLSEFGVGFEEQSFEDKYSTVTCTAGAVKVGGDLSAYVSFDFDESGNFRTMGVFE